MDSASSIPTDNTFILIFGTFTLLSVVFALILFAFLFQRKLIRKQQAFRQIEKLLQRQEIKATYAVLQAQEDERKRIAVDLHDRLGSRLAAVKLFFQAIPGTNEALTKGTELLDGAVTEVREIAHNLTSGVLIKFGLTAALLDLKETLEASRQLTIHLFIHPADLRLDIQTETSLYRIVQEIVSNALKHAKATELTVQLTLHETWVVLMVEDNGVGFAPTLVKRGMGLQNVEDRLNKMGGKLTIDTGLGRGTTLTIELPFDYDTLITSR
ncbi:hypothetical protein BWI96_05960 [Siphonobacter sp. SORGH_AS_0500]|uniref:sensor histidine kinase n=1 Tax=Siphonobacter sp. SORGH_AS_0500 TaxID=1864824 RepID=UPI000CBBD379|nr:sensor histidine kinase [Siphonobacter sp. SORGH_AS_0500]PKK37412.1 hypothetical protein BWI96_05960 [Siphonobacter sp. SORGH_AS_0500]